MINIPPTHPNVLIFKLRLKLVYRKSIISGICKPKKPVSWDSFVWLTLPSCCHRYRNIWLHKQTNTRRAKYPEAWPTWSKLLVQHPNAPSELSCRQNFTNDCRSNICTSQAWHTQKNSIVEIGLFYIVLWKWQFTFFFWVHLGPAKRTNPSDCWQLEGKQQANGNRN